ncbi:MAG: radical SAM protein [Bacteroides thetaiotaomicron]|nr:radical SAM protein [Bacteroides thetaiotaomicron]
MKPNTVWGYFWDKEIQEQCRREKKLLRAAVAIPGGQEGTECNLRCVFCFTECGTRFLGEDCIDNKTALDFLKKASRYAYDRELMNYFLVSEGEPTLNKEIVPMLKEISSLGGTVTIFSNLLVLTPEIVDAFRDIKNLFVCGKMYGYTAEVNDYLTGCPGSFERMQDNIELLLENGLADEGRLGVQCVLTSKNIGEAFDIFKWARSRKIVPHLMMFRKQGFGKDKDELEVPLTELRTFFEKCAKYDRDNMLYSWEPKLPLMVHGDCNIPGINIYLTNNGDLKLCACAETAIGNYYTDNFEDVLLCEAFEEARQNGVCMMHSE